ncbi:hypothetical protein CDD83_2762 [Cordyceps sp. RAO-2017]|nr:hypothetical protein CDD83_2762 [Cordyceps sp. RAO-2017]
MHIQPLIVALLGLLAAAEDLQLSHSSDVGFGLERRQQGRVAKQAAKNQAVKNQAAKKQAAKNQVVQKQQGKQNANVINNGGKGNNKQKTLHSLCDGRNDDTKGLQKPGCVSTRKSGRPDQRFPLPRISADLPTEIGQVPNKNTMPSCAVTTPAMCASFQLGETFQCNARYVNIQLGTQSDADKQYNDQSQRLNNQGAIIGHSHLTCEFMGANSFTEPPNAAKSASFEGAFQPGKPAGTSRNGKAQFDIALTTKPFQQAGCYRCTWMTGSQSHQNVILPVADRGDSL